MSNLYKCICGMDKVYKSYKYEFANIFHSFLYKNYNYGGFKYS